MTSPVNAQLNLDRSVDITHGLFGLTARSIHKINATEVDFAETGLLEPRLSVEMVTENGTDTLKIGGEVYDEETLLGYYGCFEG